MVERGHVFKARLPWKPPELVLYNMAQHDGGDVQLRFDI